MRAGNAAASTPSKGSTSAVRLSDFKNLRREADKKWNSLEDCTNSPCYNSPSIASVTCDCVSTQSCRDGGQIDAT